MDDDGLRDLSGWANALEMLRLQHRELTALCKAFSMAIGLPDGPDRYAARADAVALGREDIEALVREMCLASVRLDETTGRMNEELTLVRERFEPDLAALQTAYEDAEAQVKA